MKTMTVDEIEKLFREHSRLRGRVAGNLEYWLAGGSTALRYIDLIPKPLQDEERFVEIGCYQPSVGYYWSLGWKYVTGFYKDDGEGSVQVKYSSGLGHMANLIRQDVELKPLPLPDNYADVVVIMEVIEHFAIDPMAPLWELNRVLKLGGRLILSTPNAACWQNIIRGLRGRAPLTGLEYNGYSTDRHNRLYDMDELNEVLKSAGFRVASSFSRNYSKNGYDRTGKILKGLIKGCDLVNSLRYHSMPEREQYLIVNAVKAELPRERFPKGIYFDSSEWPGLAEQRELRLDKQISADT